MGGMHVMAYSGIKVSSECFGKKNSIHVMSVIMTSATAATLHFLSPFGLVLFRVFVFPARS